MFTPKEKVLVAVSGGKDSLALWDALLLLGFNAEGIHIDIGQGEFSRASKEVCLQFAADRRAKLHVFSFAETYGLSISEVARRIHYVPCAICGILKRHLMNALTTITNHHIVATGHNLDDEAATLLGNILGWQDGYLARQHPHLPEKGDTFPSRVKPLARLEESEVIAFCKFRSINFYGEKCPLSKGATSPIYKQVLHMLEEKMPGTKRRFLFGFWKKEQSRFASRTSVKLKKCAKCNHLTTSDTCLYCRLMLKAGLNPLTPLKIETLSFSSN
ncbi:MAG: adenine nucleotide alpha hydrolase family protein [Syntrophales bacterium]|nr:adenine nucleotide alpha hydrolase family protein [Syntrophales bacterium]